MVPKIIDGATRHLGAPAGWKPEADGTCGHLAIRDIPFESGSNRMVSAWEPTPAELMAITAGGNIFLQILGTQHPPVMLWAEAPPVGADKSPSADHNAAMHGLLKLLVEGRTEAEIWVIIESLCMGVGRLFNRDGKATALFVEIMAEALIKRMGI